MPKKLTIKKSAQSPVALVAGGAGFIGSYLISELLEKKARVVVLDNFNTGKEIHVQDYLKDPNFALYNADINQGLPPEVESVDYIFHLAGVEEYLFSKDFVNLDNLLTNSYGTKNLLDLAVRSQAKFLLASSIDVYQGRMSGLDLEKYFGETREEINKFSLAEAKRYAEALVWEYHKSQNIDARIVRLPEIFGPKMSLESSGILGNFMKDLIEGRDITIYGDGYEKDYYLYITDAVKGILKGLFTQDTNGKIYSLVGNDSISTLEVAFLLKGLADREMEIQFRPGKMSAKPKLVPPDSLNLREIGWKPRVGFKQGVIKTLSWFGYAPNEYGFKPGKLIEQRKKRSKKEEKFTLQGIKQEVPKEETESSINTDIPSPSVKDSSPPKETIQGLVDVAPASQPVEAPAPQKKAENIPLTSTAKLAQTPAKDLTAVGLPSVISADKAPLLGMEDQVGNSRGKGIKSLFSGVIHTLKSRMLAGFIGIILSAALIFVVIPGIRFTTNLKKGLETMKTIPEAVYMFDSSLVSSRSELAYNHLYQAKNSLQSISWIFNVTGKKSKLYSIDKMLSSLVHFSKAVYTMADVIEPLENLWSVILPDSTTSLDAESFNKASSRLSLIKNHLNRAEADYKYVDKEHFPQEYSNDLEQYGEFLSLGLNEMDLVSSIVNELPEILGMGKEKKYVVWFQNSNEIRATGGFIGSYGILEFSGGKLIDLTIDDIYNPDGQMDVRNISVPPPKQIADYLAEDRLYLRNSNWDPDFPESAEVFEDLYFKVTGEEVDGVIAVDLNFTKNLLEAIGPVFLTAYNEEISAENVYERTQYHAEFNYTNGSDQKRSFLTVLGSKLLEKLFSLDQDKIPGLLTKLGESLDARDMLIYIPDLSINAYIKEKGWDGSLISTEENYLFVVDSNLGGNKADYFIKPNMSFEVESLTRDGLLRGSLELKYEHTGQDDAWPGGVYTNFVRVYTAKGSKLTSAQLVDENGEKSDVFEDIVIYDDKNKTVFGYGLEIEPRETQSLVISFDLPQQLGISEDHKYFDLYWQKQSGSSDTPIEFIFSPPFGMQVVDLDPELELNAKVVKYSGLLNRDKHYIIKFQ